MLPGDPTAEQSRAAFRRHGVVEAAASRQPEPELVSVVIPAYNARQFIGEQLAAIASQDYGGEVEVIVADNGSTDGTASVVRQHSDRLPGLRLVSAVGRRGAAHARNVGSRAAGGAVIAYADADDRVRSDWLRRHVEALQVYSFTAGRMDQVTLSGSDAPSDTSFSWTRLPVNHDFLPWGFGGNLAIRRAAFEASGGWDETYPAVNDVPFCWRVQLSGFPLAYVPRAIVDYRPRETVRGIARQHRRFGVQNTRLYRDFRPHGARCDAPSVSFRRWARLVVSSPDLLRGPQHRRAWLRAGAFRAGLLEGSLRFRVVCL